MTIANGYPVAFARWGVVLLLLAVVHGGVAQPDSLRALKAFSPRDGLPHFFRKLKTEKRVRVAYLGGSITRKDWGWRDQTFEAMRRVYPAVALEQGMAAIGGTGSDFGLYRLREHALSANPDLVFVEFAVNDNARPYRQVLESVESIVRQTWAHDPTTDLCFVYTLSKGNLERYRNNQFSVAASAMEAVAEHYGIPSINVGTEPARLILTGQMLLEAQEEDGSGKPVFARDGVHPLVETGQRLYTDQVMAGLRVMARQLQARRGVLPPPLTATATWPVCWLPAADQAVERSAGWTSTDSLIRGKEFAPFVPSLLTSSDTTAFLRFRFKGTSFGVADVIGPGSGQLLVQVDDEPVRVINRFDSFCTYYRLNYFIINGLALQDHVVTIENSPVRLDKLSILRTRQATPHLGSEYGSQQAFIAFLFYR